MPPTLLPPRDPVQLDLASVSSIQVVGIVEALIQNADTLFPGGRALLFLSFLSFTPFLSSGGGGTRHIQHGHSKHFLAFLPPPRCRFQRLRDVYAARGCQTQQGHSYRRAIPQIPRSQLPGSPG